MPPIFVFAMTLFVAPIGASDARFVSMPLKFDAPTYEACKARYEDELAKLKARGLRLVSQDEANGLFCSRTTKGRLPTPGSAG